MAELRAARRKKHLCVSCGEKLDSGYQRANCRACLHDNFVRRNGVETITFDSDIPSVEIVAHDGNGTLWYTLDGTDPAPASGNSYVIPAGVVGSDQRQIQTSTNTIVKVAATGADSYISIQRAD